MVKEIENKSDETQASNSEITELSDENLGNVVGGECIFERNTTGSDGGAISFNENLDISGEDDIFKLNTAIPGGAIFNSRLP
ncbi:MAG: hypothetical protein MJ247_07375 [Alphaproteobacteria bacterium]|nr:hypothetical protein [Alphaproteobacteria bacterium]